MEIWKDVEWYDWDYNISNIWRLKSLKSWKEKIIKLWCWKYWHSPILLSKKWIQTWINISRLVALHFVPNPDNLPLALHKDGTLDENWRLNNWEDNLYWGTYSDNTKDKFRKWRANNNFINSPLWKWKFWKYHIRSVPVIQSKNWEFIRKWDSISDAQRELRINNVGACCRWVRKYAGWFKWAYDLVIT